MILLIFNPDFFEGRRTISLGYNCNALARHLCLLIIALISCGRIFHKKYCYIFASLGFAALILTGSRSGLLALAISLFIIYIYYYRKNRKVLRYAIIIGSIFFMAISFGAYIGMNRLSDISAKDLSNDIRVVTWQLLINGPISTHPLTGIGLGNINSQKFLQYVPDGDNMYIDVLTQLGIIGLTAILLLIIHTLRRLFTATKKALNNNYIFYPLCSILCLLGMTVTESVFDEPAFWFILGICYLYLANYSRVKKITRNSRIHYIQNQIYKINPSI